MHPPAVRVPNSRAHIVPSLIRPRICHFTDHASKIYLVFGTSNHWAPMVVNKSVERIFIHDPLSNLVQPQHAKQVLEFLSAVTGDLAYLSYSVDIARSIPKQTDGRSCGVFACVILYHLMTGAKMGFAQKDIPSWRKFIAGKIYELWDAGYAE